MMRVAFYARYSTDLQSEASIEDQVRRLKAHTQAQGWQIARSYSDAAISGASLMRPGIQTLMIDAAASKFDIVLSEALDRLSRNQADIARIYEQLCFNGVQVITLTEGVINELHIGLKGTMNALYLKDLAEKTRRGLEGRVRSGKSGGGKSYGYDIPLRFDQTGEKITGEMVVNQEEATVVRRVFEMYAMGVAPRTIAHTLNADGIKGPFGKAWGQSTINGHRTRGTGLINNELYIGRRVWNRQRYVKDPSTGKRVSRVNPKENWIVDEVPDLRIVSDELWQKVRERQKNLEAGPFNSGAGEFYDKRRPVHFWTGKIKCGRCGGSYIKISKHLLGCAASRDKGISVCTNRQNIRVDRLEDELLQSLQRHLMDPTLFSEFIEAFRTELTRLQGEMRGHRNAMVAKLARVEAQLEKAIDAILDGAGIARLKDRMQELEAEKEALKAELDSLDIEPQTLLHPNMSRIYRDKVANLAVALRADAGDLEAFNTIRGLLETVVLHPTDDGFDMDVTGQLAAMLQLCCLGSKTPKPSQLSLEGPGALAEQVKMVAGARFELTTFRL